MGYEDMITGMAISKHGYHFKYDRRMLTFEADELHGAEAPFRRWDKGVSPNDKSHAMLNMLRNVSRFDNYFGPGGIAGLRQQVLNKDHVAISQIPEHDWYDGQPLREM